MTSQRLKNFIFNHWPFIPIVIISFLLPAVWLKEKLVIAYAESGFTFFINPLRLLNLSRYIWWDIFGLGVDNARALCSVSYHLITSGLQWLGFSAVTRQYLIFSAILLLSFVSMYFLAIELLRNRKEKFELVALTMALFYILNPYTMNIWHRFITSMFGLPLIPLVFFITVKFLKKPSFRYAFLFAIVTLLFSVNAINLGYFIPLFLPAIFYIIFEVIRTKELRQWKYFGLATFLIIGLNLWWLLPLLNSAQAEYIKTISVLTDTLKVISQWTPLLFISRLIDSATIHWYGVDYHPGWIEFLIPLLAVIAILFGIKRNRNILFFSPLLIIGLFLSKGLQPPGGFIYKWMFSYIPFFGMFRSPFEKFGLIIAFSYSFLVPLGILEVRRLIKKRSISIGITAVILILLFGISVWPMWTGDVFSFYEGAIPKEAKNVPATKVKIPDYWKKAANYINQDKEDYRIVFLPQSPFDGMWYKWKYGYAGADFGSVNLLFNRPVITQYIGNSYADAYRKMVLDELFLASSDIYSPLLGLMNIHYILVRNDINETFMNTIPLARIKELLGSVKPIYKIRSFGKLDLYKLFDEYFLPHIHPSATPTIVAGDIEALIPMTETKYLDNKPVLLFTEQTQKIENSKQEMGKELISNSQFPIPSIVFKDSTWRDLAVEMTYCLSLMANGKEKIKVEKSGTYEFWLDTSELEEIPEFEIEIDGELVYSSWLPPSLKSPTYHSHFGDGTLRRTGIAHSKDRKYVKVGEVELEEGKHTFQVTKSQGHKVISQENENLKIVLVNKRERKRVEKEIWRKINQPETELCYIFEKEKGEFYVP